MNRCAIQHIVDSSYCFPVSSNEIVLRLRTAKNDIVRAQVIYESKYVIGESQKCMDMRKAYVGEIFDFYEIKLTLEDTRLAYVFYVNDGEKNYYFSEDGVTENYDFTIGFYNFFQYPYINEADITECVPWMKKAVFYQIFVDRFKMADEKKDRSYINCKWGDLPNAKSFAGGDLKGITEKLDYIKELGCNAIYLTPVFQSISNHKYDISDYYRVDPQFGTNEDLKVLVKTAHKKGIRIVLDAVFNHCSDRMVQFQDVLAKGKESRYFDWFVIKGDSIQKGEINYETFAACAYMASFSKSGSIYDIEGFFPDTLSLASYKNLFLDTAMYDYPNWLKNTLFVAVFSSLIGTVLVILTAYTISRFEFKSRKLLMKSTLVLSMFPSFMGMTAVYLIMVNFNLINQLWSLILIYVAGAPMGYLVQKGYFDTISSTIYEAARVDGATNFKVFTKITLPLSKPIIVYTALTQFAWPWSDFILPNMLLKNKNLWTVAVGLTHLDETQFTRFAAGSVFIAVPIVVLYFALSKFLVAGVSDGAVKG